MCNAAAHSLHAAAHSLLHAAAHSLLHAAAHAAAHSLLHAAAARCCAFSAARCCAFSTGGEERMHCRARGKHAAPGHRVDMSSRLPPYFTQIKSNIPLLTRLCRGPWSPPMLHPAYRHHFSAFLDREALSCEDICKKCIDHTNTSHFATIRYHEPWIWPSTS